MFEHERSLVEKHAAAPFVMVGVNTDQDPAIPERLLADGTIRWISWYDGPDTRGPIAARWRVKSWPTIYVLDAAGTIRFKNCRGPGLDHAIETLIAEARSAER